MASLDLVKAINCRLCEVLPLVDEMNTVACGYVISPLSKAAGLDVLPVELIIATPTVSADV